MRSAARRALGLVLLAAVGFAPTARAQVAATGNIYGTVKDESGAVLPGASVTLTGALGTRSTTSGTNGEFRFVNVDHGTHQLRVAPHRLHGRDAGRSRSSVGQNAELAFTLKVASVEETVTVTGDAPVVDTKRTGTATTISKDELVAIPTSRDPWALMRTVPGVMVDRVNVAGSESGQQSNIFAKGADAKDTTWSLDGVVITDMAAVGASPSYYTFDTFDEVSFSTGGNDVRVATGGLGIGLVTKRGTNSFHGSAGINFAHDDLQWSNLPDELVGDPRLQGNDKADHTDQIKDVSLRPGRPHREGQALVLRQLRQERHPHPPPQPDRGQDAAHELQRQAQLAGLGRRHGQRLLVPGRQDEDRPRRRRARRTVPRRHALEPGRRHLRRPSRASASWSGTTSSGPASSST